MTQAERRIWLIDYLRRESKDLDDLGIPSDEHAQKDMLRSLMNVRPAQPVSDEFLMIQDDYLTWEIEASKPVDVNALTHFGQDERLYLWQGDITGLKCGAIVNSANAQLLGCFIPLHDCTDNIIHTKAGVQMRLKCREIIDKQGHEEPAGSAKITPGYNLPCEYVIHTVGPEIIGEIEYDHIEQLKTCYRTCLEIADLYEIKSIAFGCISAGEDLFPNDQAANIAVSAVKDYLDSIRTGIERVVFTVRSDEDLEIYTHLLTVM